MSSSLPYYPMYVDAFDESPRVLPMTLAEVGLYQLALNEAWKRGSIPDDPAALAILIRRKPADVKKAWATVRACWVESAPGRLVNQRQEIEREKASLKSERASNSARQKYANAGANAPPNAYANADKLLSDDVSVSPNESFSGGGAEGTADDRFQKTFFSRYKRARGSKLDAVRRDRTLTRAWLDRHSDSQDVVIGALECFLTDEYWRGNKFPLAGFRSQYAKYKAIYEESLEAAGDEENSEEACEPQELAPVVPREPAWKADPAYQKYLMQLGKTGKRIDPGKAKAGYERYWPTDALRQELAGEDAEFLADSRADKPQTVPNPEDHLGSGPWDALRRRNAPVHVEKTRDQIRIERQLESYYRDNPDKRPHV